MPIKYRLYYFNATALGEISRMLFALADVEYEDIRWEEDEWVEKYKALSPYGKGPWLEIDDGIRVIKIDQSHAIAPYLAKKFGLVGDNDEEAALAMMFAEQMKDYLFSPIAPYYRDTPNDEATKRRHHRQHEEEIIPQYLDKLEKHLKSKQGGEGWLVGNKMTWADVYLAHWLDFLPSCVKITPVLDGCPKIKALVERVNALPRFANWMKNRPETFYRYL